MNSKSAVQVMALPTDDTAYRFIRLPATCAAAAAGVLAETADPFLALIVDKDEITLVLPDGVVNDYAERLDEHRLMRCSPFIRGKGYRGYSVL